MTPLAANISDAELLAFVDGWAALLETEDYEAAFAYTDHAPGTGWTPRLLREVVKAYGEAQESQAVTLLGKPTDIAQRKHVSRHAPNQQHFVGEVWYDLNIDGYISDLTATFQLQTTPEGLVVYLHDIHVM